MSATLNQFAQDQIDKARYGIQTQTYTFGPVSLPTGQSTVFSVQNWNLDNDIAKVCIIEGIAVSPQNSGVQVTWTADNVPSEGSQGWTDAYPAGCRMLPVYVVAGKSLSLVVNNQSGAAVSNFQLNYVVTVMTFNLFQGMLFGFGQTKLDTAAIQALQQDQPDIMKEINRLFAAGNRPFSMATVFDALFANRKLNTPSLSVPFHLTIPPGQTQSAPRSVPVSNSGGLVKYVYVLRGVSMEGAPAVTMTVNRDNDTDLINQLNGPAFVQADDHPWPFFVPAKGHYVITYSGSPGTYPGYLQFDAYLASDLMLAHLDLKVTPKSQIGLQ